MAMAMWFPFFLGAACMCAGIWACHCNWPEPVGFAWGWAGWRPIGGGGTDGTCKGEVLIGGGMGCCRAC
ncbi:MAG: hypothetical protein FWE70_03660 [Oscillospiraceae bacterium]|nr:hypothetical protein [Oscillospiraceae bacterium]